MPSLPTGTFTFLFTDIEGSTTLLSAPATADTRRSWKNQRWLPRQESWDNPIQRGPSK